MTWFHSRAYGRTIHDEIDAEIKNEWGTGLPDGKYAEAYATEAAIRELKLENYEIVFAQRSKKNADGTFTQSLS